VKKFFRAIIVPFLPTYEVTFTMYHVIPGMPVKKNDMTHNFSKGASAEAEAFFNKVVAKTMENKVAPTEVKLKRGRKVIKYKQFGPINDIRKYKIVA
jgi:hypothetical protein